MPFAILLGLLFATSWKAVPGQGTSGIKPSFSIAISTAQTTVKSGSAVNLKIVLTNVAGKDLITYLDGASRGELDYTLHVVDENGKEPSETKYFRAVLNKDASDPGETTTLVVLRDAGLRSIKPKGTETDTLDLNKLYDLRPGNCTLQVEREDDESKAVVKSNKITLTITQ